MLRLQGVDTRIRVEELDKTICLLNRYLGKFPMFEKVATKGATKSARSAGKKRARKSAR